MFNAFDEGKVMQAIKKKYITDENNKRIGVQLDMDTFNKIEETLENYALYQFIIEDKDDVLNVQEAKRFYDKLDKSS